MTILILVTIVILVLGFSLYNGLIRRRNRVEQAYSGIEVQMVQRYDLIPKLVETVRQYMGHEKSLLEEVVRLRNTAAATTDHGERMRVDNQLSGALGQLRVTMEGYPELKSSDNFLQLQRSLNEVEEQLAAARRSYNSAVVDYNNAVQTYPSGFVANMMNFRTEEMFEAEAHKRADVDMRGLFTT